MEHRQEMRLTFGKDDDLVCISHRNVASLFERAMRRAGIPVAYSEGYNPRPRISFPSALETGIASDCEVAFVRLSERCEPGLLAERLTRNLPGEIAVKDVGEAGGPRSVKWARYDIELPESGGPDQADLDRLLEDRSIERTRSGRTETVKLAKYVRKLERHDTRLVVEIATDDRGSLRPSEVVEALALLPLCDTAVRRTHVELG
ncbi:TIGR03936 family radical SAM-associated protein [Planctomycetota bacterium]